MSNFPGVPLSSGVLYGEVSEDEALGLTPRLLLDAGHFELAEVKRLAHIRPVLLGNR